MKLLMTVLVVLALTSGAHATDYFWDCATVGAWGTHMNPGVWDDCANWASGYNALPGAADNAWMLKTGTLRIPKVNGFSAQNNPSVTYGQFVVSNGATILYPYSLWTLNVVDDCGGTGDFIIRTAAGIATVYNSRTTFNIDGNVLLNNTTAFYYGYNGRDTFNLYGANKGFRNQSTDATSGAWVINIYGSYFDNGLKRSYTCNNTVNVKSGGQIVKRPNAPSEWWARDYNFEGGQSNLPALGDCVTFGYQPAKADNGTFTARLAIAGGIQYPNDVRVGSDYWGGKAANDATYVYRLKGGDLNVGRDLKIHETAGTSRQDGVFINFEENGTLAKRNATILRDFLVDEAGRGYAGLEWFGFRGKDATIRVGRNLQLGADTTGYYSWNPRNATKVDLGNATIYIGGNLTMHRPDAVFKAFWNPGTSTIVMDGNGTLGSPVIQVVRTFGYLDCVALNNLVINNPRGSVVLDNVNWGPAPAVKPGGLLLKGNLEINSRFNDSNLPIAFNGPEHLLKIGPTGSLAGGSLDNIILLTDAVMRLGSDVTMDNIEMQSGAQLFLNGFTLMADGKTWQSDQIGSLVGVAYEQGMIYGTMPIPEPATLLLIGTGALGVIGWVRRRRMA